MHRTHGQVEWERAKRYVDGQYPRREPAPLPAPEPEIDRLRAMLAHLHDFHDRQLLVAALHLGKLGDRDRERLRPQYDERARARAVEIADVERRIAQLSEDPNADPTK